MPVVNGIRPPGGARRSRGQADPLAAVAGQSRDRDPETDLLPLDQRQVAQGVARPQPEERATAQPEEVREILRRGRAEAGGAEWSAGRGSMSRSRLEACSAVRARCLSSLPYPPNSRVSLIPISYPFDPARCGRLGDGGVELKSPTDGTFSLPTPATSGIARSRM